MKFKSTKLYILLALAVSTVACGDAFLQMRPLSTYTPESVYTDEVGFNGVLVTLRKNLRVEFYGNTGGIGCEMIASDVAITANKEASAVHNFNTQLLPTMPSGNFPFLEIWENGYNQIRNTNVILSRLEGGKFSSEASKNAIKAEALFHRCYWYYRLVHVFGDVPFLSREYTAPKIDFYTHSRKTILAKIEEDMSWAAPWLPTTAQPGAVAQGAGYHLLTKIYLANSKFDKAVEAASKVIDGGDYSLMKTRFGQVSGDQLYNVIWDLHQKENKSISTNKEALLVVQEKYGFPEAEIPGGTQTMRRYTPAWWNNYWKDPDGKQGASDAMGNEYVMKWGRGVGYVRPVSYYNYDIWSDPTDLRHDTVTNWFPTSKFVYNNPASNYYGQPVNINLLPNPTDTIHCWFPFPYYKVFVADEERPTQPYGGHSDWYLFRLAETYLLRAEAYYWMGNTTKAAADINEVRVRAKAAPCVADEVDISYILDERARELYAEEPRKTEITRMAYIMADNNINGYSIENFSTKNFWYDRVMAKNSFYRAGNILWGTNIYAISPFHVLWPIPANAIDTNVGGVINQNIGYVGTEKNKAPLTIIDDNQ